MVFTPPPPRHSQVNLALRDAYLLLSICEKMTCNSRFAGGKYYIDALIDLLPAPDPAMISLENGDRGKIYKYRPAFSEAFTKYELRRTAFSSRIPYRRRCAAVEYKNCYQTSPPPSCVENRSMGLLCNYQALQQRAYGELEAALSDSRNLPAKPFVSLHPGVSRERVLSPLSYRV